LSYGPYFEIESGPLASLEQSMARPEWPARFFGNRKGATAVEFALIAPILITLLIGVIEFALMFFTYNAAGQATWSVTRRLATNQITTAQVSDLITSAMPSWVRSGATVTTASSSTDPHTNRFTVTVSFPASAASPTNFLLWAYGNRTLTATTVMQQEPTT
jgi:Flp pilus assembly protein TadG